MDTANSASSGMDMMPIMNVFNEWHSANTSKKIRAVVESGAKSGKYRTTFASYGYFKGDDEKRTPVIDPVAAAVVRRIFEMRAAGYNMKRIAQVLNDEGILTPDDYRYSLLNKETPHYSLHLWSVETIKRLLRNQIYIGNLAQLRTTTVSYKNHKVIRKEEDEWVVVENNHEPIISRELWDKVREIEASVSTGKMTKQGITLPLTGLCYCADCGSKFKQAGSAKRKSTVTGYSCGQYARFGKKYCSSHFITAHALQDIVLADIKRQIDFVMNDDKAREKYLARKQGLYAEQHSGDKKKLRDINKRIAELDRLIASVYEDKVTGKMPEDMAFTLLDKYQTEKKSLQSESDEMQKHTDMAKQDEADVDEYIRRLKSYAGAEELTRQMALDLIEYITIDENPRKKAIPRDIHIYYKLIDKPLKNKNNALAEQAGAIKK